MVQALGEQYLGMKPNASLLCISGSCDRMKAMGEASGTAISSQVRPSDQAGAEVSRAPGDGARRLRFVLLVSPISSRPARLLKGLHERGLAVRVVHDAALAMAELALFKAQVLIVHEAGAIGPLEALLDAVRVYHPEVLCWRHEPADADGAGVERERLSPFQCALDARVQPRFTPAPDHLGPSHTTHRNGKASAPHAASDSAQVVSPRLAVREADHAAAAADKPPTHPNGPNGQNGLNGHHGLHLHQPPCNEGPLASLQEARSWGQKLAAASGEAGSDDPFSPLLTAEEIELLRGPIDKES